MSFVFWRIMNVKIPNNLADRGWDEEIYCRTCQKLVRVMDSYGDDESRTYYCWPCWNLLRPKIQCNLCEKSENEADFFPCHSDPHSPDAKVLCKICHIRHLVKCNYPECNDRLNSIENEESITTLKLNSLHFI